MPRRGRRWRPWRSPPRRLRIAALLLAAGASRRFGSDKRLHSIDGVPLLARTLDVYRRALPEVAVVIRPHQPDVAAIVRTANCRIVEAADARLGQSRSLAAGVRAMQGHDGLLIGLADMPFVEVDTLRLLVASMVAQPQQIVRPRSEGRPGNPIGFPSRLFESLTQIEGDQGARQIVAASDDVVAVDVDDPGIHQDIDRPPDLARS